MGLWLEAFDSSPWNGVLSTLQHYLYVHQLQICRDVHGNEIVLQKIIEQMSIWSLNICPSTNFDQSLSSISCVYTKKIRPRLRCQNQLRNCLFWNVKVSNAQNIFRVTIKSSSKCLFQNISFKTLKHLCSKYVLFHNKTVAYASVPLI